MKKAKRFSRLALFQCWTIAIDFALIDAPAQSLHVSHVARRPASLLAGHKASEPFTSSLVF